MSIREKVSNKIIKIFVAATLAIGILFSSVKKEDKEIKKDE
jgi:hypothetical protein